MSIVTLNPSTGQLIREFKVHTDAEIEGKIALAHSVFEKSLAQLESVGRERAQKLSRLADLLIERKEEYGRLMTLEMGKTFKAAVAEIEKCALNARYYAENGLAGLAKETISLPKAELKGEIHYHPTGIVLAIMPWNFPFWQVLRCACPILLSGNSMLLKHASNVPQCALAIEKLFVDAGFPAGAFQTLLVDSKKAGELIADDRIQGVTLTGSEPAGRDVAAKAGAAIKKAVLELGGSDPFVVMPSCVLATTVQRAVEARLMNNGQSCIAAKRFIVHDSVYEKFCESFVEQMKAAPMGDPMGAETKLGPVVSKKARDDLHALVQDACQKGAKLLTGGAIPSGEGFYYPATVIEGIPADANLRREEAFGPVASLYRVSSFEEAIALANSTRFGLGASFWSTDENEIEIAKTSLQAGSVFINTIVASDPHLPFGGVKASGIGRELGILGLREFTNIKTIVKMSAN